MMTSSRDRRDAWLSLTPEPESDLPRALATLRAGGAPSQDGVEAERARAEGLVLRGSRRRWLAWLREGLLAAEEAAPGPEVEAAREVVLDVIANHHALVRGLPGDSERAIEDDQALLERLDQHQRDNINEGRDR
jgi:hypothetical protein